jgi:hypothetical protein
VRDADPAVIEAVIAQVRAEAIAHNAPAKWILYVQTGDDGCVECCGAPWWPETQKHLRERGVSA